jgi:hypothetical protein
MKRYKIDENGEVVECSKFATIAGAVEAKTKKEATQKLLKSFAHVLENSVPTLYVKNGAYNIVFADTDGGFTSKSGRLSNALESGFISGCAMSNFPFRRKAEESENFKFYTSEENYPDLKKKALILALQFENERRAGVQHEDSDYAELHKALTEAL